PAARDDLPARAIEQIAAHAQALTDRALRGLQEIDESRIIAPGPSPQRRGAVSFDLAGRHPHDVGQVLDPLGIEVRVGHHCAWPLHRRFGIHGTTRASFSVHTTPTEVDALIEGVSRTVELFRTL